MDIRLTNKPNNRNHTQTPGITVVTWAFGTHTITNKIKLADGTFEFNRNKFIYERGTSYKAKDKILPVSIDLVRFLNCNPRSVDFVRMHGGPETFLIKDYIKGLWGGHSWENKS